ncbi:hypothetical protein A0H81_09315 [Grifola frondosa]|uniref:Elongator complex protein 5 n=1 Tax=Grifola frondosa TaxID=5627 RepID=A0A1C7M1T5_GRIFR|nr:hypothetical protein A0H81_09315 [Grifola frondosa]
MLKLVKSQQPNTVVAEQYFLPVTVTLHIRLQAFTMFPPQGLPLPGEILLITDELSSPADFILLGNLSAHLKNHKDSKCIVLSVSEDLTRWKAISGKSVEKNLNLAQYMSSQSLIFIDVITNVASQGARRIWGPVLVILDDVATLEWTGVSILELSRFVRALCALSRKANAALILRHHIVTPGEPDDILRHLLQLCTYHMDVLPLSTGRSGSVALHAGPAVVDPHHHLIPKSMAIQYRLTDTGAVFFDRGTGGGVL